ncbi:MAG: hypothetical protein NTW46_03385, partial [Candidatus Nealsonbacteria bacterium]|nr:hypothetical protein [Candidatus Nealsonbacteria bacterium]
VDFTLSGTVTPTTATGLTVGGNLTLGANTTLTTGANYAFAVTGTTSIHGTLANTNTGAKTYTGLVTVETDGTFTNATNSAITFQGGITNNKASGFSFGTGVINFDTNAQAIGGIESITFASMGVTSAIVVTNNLLSSGGDSLTVSTTLGGSGTLTQGSGASLKIGGTSTITNMDASANPNTVEYYAGGDQTVKAVSYNNLILSTSGIKTMTSVTTVTGDLTVSGSATMTDNGALVITGSLVYSSSGSSTLKTGTDVSIGKLNQTGGAIVDNANTVTVTGTGASVWAESGTFTATGTVNFTGAVPQIGASNFYNLTITNSATFTGSNTITGTFKDIIPNSTLTFADNGTYTITNINIHGSGAGNVIMTWASGVHGHWHFVVSQANPTVTYVTVDHSDATGSSSQIDATSNCSGNNTTYWIFVALSLTAPSSVTMPDYTLGGAGYSELNFADAIQVSAGLGFTVTISSTNLVGVHTISNTNVKLKTNDNIESNPTRIPSTSCSGFSGVDEPVAGEYSLDSPQTIVATSSGSGTCNIYPTLRVYISDISSYAENYTGVLTVTVTY